MTKDKMLEAVVDAVERTMRPNARVERRARVRDHATGTGREVDVLLHYDEGGERISVGVECRNHKRKVGVAYIEQIATKKADLRLSRFHVVSASGFTSGAISKARAHKVVLSTLSAVEAGGWSLWPLKMKFYDTERRLGVLQLTFEIGHVGCQEPEGFISIKDEYKNKRNVRIYSSGDEQGQSIGDLLAEAYSGRFHVSVGESRVVDARLKLRGSQMYVDHAGTERPICAIHTRIDLSEVQVERRLEVFGYIHETDGRLRAQCGVAKLLNGALVTAVADGKEMRLVLEPPHGAPMAEVDVTLTFQDETGATVDSAMARLARKEDGAFPHVVLRQRKLPSEQQ